MMRHGFWAFLLMVLFSGVAQAADWVVERTTKNVSVSINGSSWRPIKVGDAIPNAYWVRTGSRARVLLAKGSERIMYRENTLAAISVSQPKGKKTKITQQRGSILLAMKKRRTQHTNVVTPHLAAVVKGTVFEVTVGKRQSRVRVDRGLVQVSNDNGSVDVPGGQEATTGPKTTGISVSEATTTSLDANGAVGLSLAKTKSSGNANSGNNGNGNSGNNGNGNSGNNGNGNSGNNGNGNSGNNGNGNGNSGNNGNGNSGNNGNGNGNSGNNGNGNGN